MRSTASTASNAVKIHAIQTGIVRIRANQIQGKGHGTLRILRTYSGVTWSNWLPIYAWVIEHPEGLIVVDTGETARAAEPGYFPGWHPFYRRGVEEQIKPEEEIGPQIENGSLDPHQVRRVVMTHLHTDHAGGLNHFPTSEILIEPHDYATASGLKGRLRGYLPNRWPEWLQPTFITFEPIPFGPFDRSFPLTAASDVVIVPTPGHTDGHVSVVVRTDELTYFLAGDTSYTEALMLAGQVDGIAPDENLARETLHRIRMLAEQEPLVYLPAHDPDSANRLRTGQTAIDLRRGTLPRRISDHDKITSESDLPSALVEG